MKTKEIIEEFDVKSDVFSSLEAMTCSLLNSLISLEKIQVHSITSRTKDRDSLIGKINRPGKSYEQLCEITDIVGFRITTYFSNDVDSIANLIEKEFSIDKENSIDKRKALEPDRFGYMSLHLVCEHKNNRLRLPEYSQYKAVKFEIQIRSILQHAWAEIEHDIGYKSTNEVPDQLRRRFSRLAGLLELADEEFQSIKNDIEIYKESLPDKVNNSPQDVTLDLESLVYFISTDPSVIEIEKEMKEIFNSNELVMPDDRNLSHSLGFLNRMKIYTLSDLQQKYSELKENIIPFLKEWLADDTHKNVSKGISLLYLTYINLARIGDDNFSKHVLSVAPFSNIDLLVNEIANTWKKI